MKMKKLFKFFCMMVAMIVGQSVWAQGVDPVYVQVKWTETQLDSIKPTTPSTFQRTTDDGLVRVTIASDADVTFQKSYVWPLGSSNHLEFGYIFKNQLTNGFICWGAAQKGYQVQMRGVETVSQCAGGKCWYSLNGGEERQVNSSWITDDAVFDVPTDTVKFYFRGDPSRSGGDGPASSRAAMATLGFLYQITPNAPEYLNKEMLVTVDTTNIHWYSLSDQVNINPAFASTLKFDVKSAGKNSSKYIVWSATADSFYVVKPLKFTIKAYIEKKDGAYNASEVTTWNIQAKVPQEETPQIFYFVDDEWVRTVNDDGENTIDFYVTNPIEHFVEYVCADQSEVTYLEKSTNCLDYLESPRDRHDYFHFQKRVMGDDVIRLQIGAAGPSVLNIHAIGLELNRVPFLNDSEKMFMSLRNREKFGSDTTCAVWDANWKDAGEKKGVPDVVRFQGANAFVMDKPRVYEIHFLGVPDSLFYEYGNAVTNDDNGRLKVHWSADGKTWAEVRSTIKGPHLQSEGKQVYDSLKLDRSAQYLRFIYSTARNAAYVKNIKVTAIKQLDILPQDTLIDFGSNLVRVPDSVVTKKDSLSWINLFPELLYTVDAPFSADGRIPVRPDKFDTIRSHNKFNIHLNMDTIGIFTKRLKVASMDVEQPMAAYVTLKAQVNLNTKDMFARINGKLEGDSIFYGDTSVITITDSLGTVLTYDSLQLEYEYVDDSLQIKNDTVTNVCVGNHIIIVKAKANTLLPEPWQDTLYIYARENEKDSITFNVPAEIGMKDTLPADFVVALDSVAELSYEFDKPEYFEVTAEGRLVAKKNAKADSVWVKVTASETCEHFSTMDSVRVWVRRVVTTEFNDSVEWMTNVFGNDTLKNPLFVKNDDKTAFENTDSLTIAFEYNPNDVVVDSVANQWYLRRSEEKDSLFVKVTVSGDSIKTVKDSIKFPVREYIASITWPGTVDDRGYYYVGDTLKVADFIATATNPERAGKDLTKLVNWTKTFVEAADGTVLEDGSVLLDSVNTSVLQVCLDTLFVRDTCAYDTLIVKPAVVKDLFFPGVDSIYVVGDSIAVRDIVVKDTADRDISRYVRYNFAYIPEDFAHNTGDSLNMFRDSVFTDFIVLDKNGLDTAAVDTVVSRTQGGLVTEKEFKDRLLIAPVYAVEVVWDTLVFTVGDTVRTSMLTAYSGKNNDVTRYSSFIFVAADSVAERINDTTIVMKKAGQVMVKVVAKRNESMHQSKFTQMLTVNPIMLDSIAYGNTNLTVFDSYNTDSVRIFNKGRDITKYAELTFKYDGQCAWNGSEFVVEEAGKFPLTTYVGGNNVVADTLSQDIDVVKYANVAVVFDAAEFVVADSVSVSRFSLVDMATGKEIDKKYYQFNYELLEENFDAEWISASAFIMDSLKANVKVSVDAAQKAIADFDTIVEVTAKPATADRVVFPDSAFLVGEGFAIADLQVFDVKNRDITRYAKNEFLVDQFKFNPSSRAGFNAAKDSIYFNNFGQVAITPVVGTLLVNQFSKKYMMGADQVKATRIVLPAGPYVVGNTLLTKDFSVFAGDKDVTALVKDLSLSLAAEDGHAVDNGVMLDKKGKVVLRSEVIGRSNSENKVQYDTIQVEPVVAATMQLPKSEYTVLEQMPVDSIKFFDAAGVDITRYVEPGYSWDNTKAHMIEDGKFIVMDVADELTIRATINGNAKCEGEYLEATINVSAFEGARIVQDKFDFVIGDTLTAAYFHLENADEKVITPVYGNYVLTCDPAYCEDLGESRFVLNKWSKGNTVAITATYVNGDVNIDPDPYEGVITIKRAEVAEVLFQDTYTMGDTIWIDDLTMLNKDGEDITRYTKGSVFVISINPNAAADDDDKSYIALNTPGSVEVTLVMQSDSISLSSTTNTIFVDNLVPTMLVLPEKEYQVGDTMLASEVRVFAGKKDISKLADVELIVNEKEGHYIKGGFVFDQKGAILVGATISGYTGVRTLYVDSTYNVAPLVPFAITNMPEIANVLQVVNTANFIYTDEDGKDITKYVENVEFKFDNEKAHYDAENKTIVFDSIGTVKITAILTGNVEGTIKDMEVEISAFVDAEIVFAGATRTYHVAEMVELRDFALVDKNTRKAVYTDYQLSIESAQGEKMADGNIRLDNISPVTVKASVTGQVEIAPKEFAISVVAANAAYVIYPKDADYLVGKSIAISDLQVKDSMNRDLTRYLRPVDFSFKFDSTATAHADARNIYFDLAGKMKSIAEFGNTLVNTTIDTTVLAIDQIKAKRIELDEDEFTVGESLSLSAVHVFDAVVDGNEITDLKDMFFLVDDKVAHLDGDNLVFDDVKATTVTVGIKGYKNVAKAALTAGVTVNPIEAVRFEIEGLEDNYMLFDQFDTNGKVKIYAEGDVDVTNYADVKVTVSNAEINAKGVISFNQVGDANVVVTLKGYNVVPADPGYDDTKVVKVGKYTKAEIQFKGAEDFYVADEVSLSDFVLVDTETGRKMEAAYALDFKCVEGGRQIGNKIVLDTAGIKAVEIKAWLKDNDQLSADTLTMKLDVNQANLAYIIYEDKSYVVGDSMLIAGNAKILFKDSVNRDITRYATGAIREMKFDGKDDMKKYADYKNGKVYFLQKGEVKVTAIVGNDKIADADITAKWYINQREANSFELVDRERQVGDTLRMSDVTIYDDLGNDITDADKLFFIYDAATAHGVEGSADIIYDKQTDNFKLTVAIKGYDNVQKYAFDTTLKVLPREVDTIILPEKAGGYEVLDSMNIDEIQVLDKFGHDLTKAPYNYATLQVVPAASAKIVGNKIVFYEADTVAIEVYVSGNAEGQDAPRVVVGKNTTAMITVPEKDVYYVGDEIKLSAFDLVDKNGKKFDAAYSLSFDIAEGFGRKLEDEQTIVIDSLTEDRQVKFTITAAGQVDIDTMEFVPTVRPCVVDRVVFPDVRFIVGDSIAIDSLVLLDAVNKDLTRYAEYRGFEFELASAASYDLEKGYIYFLEPGVVKVTTKVGLLKYNKMEQNDNLVNKIFIEQAAADSVAIKDNVRTVGDTLDIKDVEAFDKNGNKLTIYSDLQFVFDATAAHYAEEGKADKIILDKAGDKTISILVDGRKGVEQKTLVPELTVNRVAVDSVAINGDYKVTGTIATSAVQAFAANGLDITRYVGTITYSIDPQVAEPKDADYMFIKSGDQTINVVLNGADIVETTVPVVKNIAKCVADSVTFPEDNLRVGDVIKKDVFQVFDADGMNITRFADIKFAFDPTTAAELTGDGDIKINATGTFTLSVTVSRDVEDKTFTEDYFVRHKITDDKGDTVTYDLLVQVWEDMLLVDNSGTTVPQFVSYVWYMDEQLIQGQTSQNYYVRDADRDGKDHVFYVIATDAKGNSYLIEEQTFNFGKKNNTPARFIAYPAMLKSNSLYNVEASVEGNVTVTNVNGAQVDQYRVESGKQTVAAPLTVGVYVIRYQAADGQTATQKMIVK